MDMVGNKTHVNLIHSRKIKTSPLYEIIVTDTSQQMIIYKYQNNSVQIRMVCTTGLHVTRYDLHIHVNQLLVLDKL